MKPDWSRTAARSLARRCSGVAPGVARCGGMRQGIRRSSDSSRSWSSSRAARRWPWWTGSKVPPKMPIISGSGWRPAAGQASGFLATRYWSRATRPLSLFTHMPVAEDDELLGGQALQPHGAAGVELVGADADLGAQPVLEAVGEAGGGVHHHGAGIHLAQEAPRAGDVFGHDGFGVMRAVGGDVLHGGIHVGHDADRQDGP